MILEEGPVMSGMMFGFVAGPCVLRHGHDKLPPVEASASVWPARKCSFNRFQHPLGW
jgi:hypothetical protein